MRQVGGPCSPGQLRNMKLCSQVQEVHRSLLTLLPRMHPPAAAALMSVPSTPLPACLLHLHHLLLLLPLLLPLFSYQPAVLSTILRVFGFGGCSAHICLFSCLFLPFTFRICLLSYSPLPFTMTACVLSCLPLPFTITACCLSCLCRLFALTACLAGRLWRPFRA